MKKNLLFLGFTALVMMGCNEPDASVRDYKKLPEMLEHCLTLSDDEIVTYLQKNGYSTAWFTNEGTADQPHNFLAFCPSSVFEKYADMGEEMMEAYYDSGDFFIGIFFETGNNYISGDIAYAGDFDQEMALFKSYSKWAYKNLPEFSTYEWRGYLNGEDFIEGSRFEETYDLGGFKEYMHALDTITSNNVRTHNSGLGPNNRTTGVILPDYEIAFDPDECVYSRVCWRK